MHTAFGILDRNSDGHVYAEDIYDMLQALGHNVDKSEIQDFIKDAANGGNNLKYKMNLFFYCFTLRIKLSGYKVH